MVNPKFSVILARSSLSALLILKFHRVFFELTLPPTMDGLST